MRKQEKRLHTDTLEELSSSFDDDIEPMVVEIQGTQHRLTGTAELNTTNGAACCGRCSSPSPASCRKTWRSTRSPSPSREAPIELPLVPEPPVEAAPVVEAAPDSAAEAPTEAVDASASPSDGV